MNKVGVSFDKNNKVFIIKTPILRNGLPSIDIKKVRLIDVIRFIRRYRFVNRNLKCGYVVPRRELLEEIAWRELREKDSNDVSLLINAFQGGTYRAVYYFPKYYLPLQVLRMKGFILVRGGKIISSEEKIKKALNYLIKLKRGD